MTKPHRPRATQKHGQKTQHGHSTKSGHAKKPDQTEKGKTPRHPQRKFSHTGAGRYDGDRRHTSAQGPAGMPPRAFDETPERGSSLPRHKPDQMPDQMQDPMPGQAWGENLSGTCHEPWNTTGNTIGNTTGNARSVHDEENTQPPLLPGVKPVLEMLIDNPERIDAVFIRKGRHGKEMDEILDRCRKAGVRFSLLEPSAFAKQLGQTQTQGVVARLFESGFTPFESLLDTIMDAPLPLLVALDQVQDPGNAGTLARTLYALGGAGLIIPRHNSVYLGAGAARAAAGALQKLPVAKVGSLSQAVDSAQKMGITIYGAAAAGGEASVPVTDLFALTPRFPALLLLGSEEKGIRPTLVKRCHSLVSIPMQRDFDSLNVAQAGAICIASFLRRHLAKG